MELNKYKYLAELAISLNLDLDQANRMKLFNSLCQRLSDDDISVRSAREIVTLCLKLKNEESGGTKLFNILSKLRLPADGDLFALKSFREAAAASLTNAPDINEKYNICLNEILNIAISDFELFKIWVHVTNELGEVSTQVSSKHEDEWTPRPHPIKDTVVAVRKKNKVAVVVVGFGAVLLVILAIFMYSRFPSHSGSKVNAPKEQPVVNSGWEPTANKNQVVITEGQNNSSTSNSKVGTVAKPVEPTSPSIPIVTPADMEPYKADAEKAWDEIKAIDHGQGFDLLLDRATKTRNKAEKFLQQNNYVDARAAYQDFLDQCKKINEQDNQRQAAEAAYKEADTSRQVSKKVGAEGNKLWDEAEQLTANAQAAFGKGNFTEALQYWQKAKAEYDNARQMAEKQKVQIAGVASDNIVVTVNGVNITEGEVDKLISMQLTGTPNRSPESIEQYKKLLRQPTLDALIAGHLLDEKVKDANIIVTDEEATNRLKEIAAAQRPAMSLEDFRKKIEEYGQNFDEVKEQVRKGLSYQKLIEAQPSGKISVTEADANNFYTENRARFETPEQVRASHILIKPDLNTADPNEAKAKALAKIKELLEQIKGGADFAQLARENSACPSAARGGDLDFFPRGRMEPTFEKVAFATDVNQVSDIVETSYGYHIIKVTDHKAASITPSEQVKDQITNQLKQGKLSEFAQQYIQSLRAKANIVYPRSKEPQLPQRIENTDTKNPEKEVDDYRGKNKGTQLVQPGSEKADAAAAKKEVESARQSASEYKDLVKGLWEQAEQLFAKGQVAFENGDFAGARKNWQDAKIIYGSVQKDGQQAKVKVLNASEAKQQALKVKQEAELARKDALEDGVLIDSAAYPLFIFAEQSFEKGQAPFNEDNIQKAQQLWSEAARDYKKAKDAIRHPNARDYEKQVDNLLKSGKVNEALNMIVEKLIPWYEGHVALCKWADVEKKVLSWCQEHPELEVKGSLLLQNIRGTLTQRVKEQGVWQQTYARIEALGKDESPEIVERKIKELDSYIQKNLLSCYRPVAEQARSNLEIILAKLKRKSI